jgi:succinate dehydrogenase / fumarate reductase, flavoprotein subunit
MVDVLVVGSGAAGLRTAIELHSLGIDCLVIGKCKMGNAHTSQATGGINAALGTLDRKDHWLIHAADTLKEGQFLADQKTIEILCREAPRAIRDLEEYGMRFHREKDGRITQRFFGAQLYRRACFFGDETGKELLRSLIAEAKKRDIKFHDNVYITKILKKGKRAVGLFGIDLRTGKFHTFKAKAIVLAMGGFSRVYRRSSSRLFENTGDGASLAFNAGAELIDMELVQFHPTGMVWPRDAEGILVTESVRGEGGKLYNGKGRRFMLKYPRAELGPRDEVARAIYDEIRRGRGTKHKGVWLDISHRPKKYIINRLPKMFKQFKQYLNIDISKQRMEVAPTSHYTMGGVRVNFPSMQTKVKGLFAVGEIIGGTHGGNRLGGNSLLECIVFGRHAGQAVAKFVKQNGFENISDDKVEAEKAKIKSLLGKKGNPEIMREEIQEIMWKYAGILRNKKGLETALRKINKLKNKSITVSGDMKNNEQLALLLNVKNMLVPCEAIITGALKRQESRGAHYRVDFPKASQRYQGNFIFDKKGISFIKAKRLRGKILKVLREIDDPITHHLE